jgi:hypothetical protein
MKARKAVSQMYTKNIIDEKLKNVLQIVQIILKTNKDASKELIILFFAT